MRFVEEVASVTNKTFEENDYVKASFMVKQTMESNKTEGSRGGLYSCEWVVAKEESWSRMK